MKLLHVVAGYQISIFHSAHSYPLPLSGARIDDVDPRALLLVPGRGRAPGVFNGVPGRCYGILGYMTSPPGNMLAAPRNRLD